MVPHYNSKTTTIVLVIEGRGRLEMGCPHLSHQGQGSQEPREQREEEESSGRLQKLTAELSPGDVFIIPAGHPIALVAQNENLRTVGFGINALNNQRNFLAGKINIMNQVEREAMEIAFNVPARLIERIISDNPKESYFVAGPELARPEGEQQREEGKGHSLPSVLDLVGF
ncbi:vicilin GC72-A-like [Pistacia vera]|uniref:vicilin GC72-A-like n=1 Tax=Pistacia vera TaxID=55513 RepID=UPI001263529D|nr:vicilin GC72-A-like [Pistacia vera]